MQKEGNLYSLFIVIILSFVLFSVSVYSDESFFYNSVINYNLDSNYSAGSNLTTTITLSNNEKFPIADATLSLQLVHGCSEPIYPSQGSDCDNIIDEVILKNINLAPNSNYQIPFSYVLPANLQSGTYRLDAYLVARKTPMVGIPGILLPGMYRSFYINGTTSMDEVKILRTKTNLANVTGPIGFGVDKGQKVILNVFLDSNYEGSAKLSAKIFDWEDISGKFIAEKSVPISLKKGEQEFNIEFTAPESTSAYPIRLEVSDGNKLLSLYKSRIVVKGESAKIRKLYPDKILYGSEKAKVTVLVGSSPDHYTNPTTKDILLEVNLTNSNGETYKKSKTIQEMISGNYTLESFNFPVKSLRDYEICATLRSSNEIYDSECYKVTASDFHSSANIIELKSAFQDNKFIGQLCTKDSITLLPSKADVSFVVTKSVSVVTIGERSINNCSDISFDFDPKFSYELRAYDKKSSQEFIFNISKEENKKISNIFNGNKNRVLIIGAVILFIIILFIIIKLFKKPQ